MEHQVGDVLREGTSDIKNENGDTTIYVDDRIVLLICSVGIIIDIALIMSIVSCAKHIAKWLAPH